MAIRVKIKNYDYYLEAAYYSKEEHLNVNWILCIFLQDYFSFWC